MKNRAEFDIIGRTGRIARVGKAVKVNICSNFARKVNDEWVEEEFWNTVTVFGDKFQQKVEKMGIGDLVVARGRMRQNRYEKDGETVYATDFIADELDVLARKGAADDASGGSDDE